MAKLMPLIDVPSDEDPSDAVVYRFCTLITDRGTIYREYHCDHPGDSLADPWPWWR